MANVAHDADDLTGLVPTSGPDDQSLAQCLFIWKHCVYKLLADYEYLVALSNLLLGEVAPALQRDSHRTEVALIHSTKAGKCLVGRIDRTAFDCERHVHIFTTEWQFGNAT